MTVAELETGERVEAVEQADRPETAVAEEATHERLYRFSRHLHVGPGAEECEEGERGTCNDPLHFHAWIRMPNKFQHKDIREKALAAKARRVRALRDPDSDECAVLDERIEALRDPANIEAIVEEIIQKEWPQDYLTAVRDVSEEPDPEDEDGERKRFEHIDQDRERYQALSTDELAKPEEERSEEFRGLQKRVGEYIDAIKARVDEIQEPKRQALAERGLDGVLEVLRRQRIEDEGDAAFVHTYNEWMWYVGTLRPVERGVPHARVWSALGNMDNPKEGTMWAAAPEIIEAVEGAFHELDAALQKAARGNS